MKMEFDQLVELTRKEKRKEMGNAGRKFIENNFTWEKIASNFIKDLEKQGIK